MAGLSGALAAARGRLGAPGCAGCLAGAAPRPAGDMLPSLRPPGSPSWQAACAPLPAIEAVAGGGRAYMRRSHGRLGRGSSERLWPPAPPSALRANICGACGSSWAPWQRRWRLPAGVASIWAAAAGPASAPRPCIATHPRNSCFRRRCSGSMSAKAAVSQRAAFLPAVRPAQQRRGSLQVRGGARRASPAGWQPARRRAVAVGGGAGRRPTPRLALLVCSSQAPWSLALVAMRSRSSC